MPAIKVKNRVALPEKDRKKLADALQRVLNPFQELNLQVKQAHWAVAGKDFKSFHLTMDELYTTYAEFIDRIAERSLALGFVPAGQVKDIAAKPALEPLPGGFVEESILLTAIADRIATVAAQVRKAHEGVGGLDIVTDDLFTEILASTEQTLWMFGAEEATA